MAPIAKHVNATCVGDVRLLDAVPSVSYVDENIEVDVAAAVDAPIAKPAKIDF